MKKILAIVLLVLVLNGICIFFCIKDGLENGDMMFRFREHDAVTFLSALLMGLTSEAGLILYLLKRKMPSAGRDSRFWLFSAIGFFYLCMDEYFMAHEGMDEWVGSLFGKDVKQLNLDSLVLLTFGLVALGICLRFRREIIRHKVMLPFLFLGAAGLVGTVIFHLLERIDIVYEVTEESLKIIGVSFFFAGYITALTSFIKRTVSISPA